MTVRPPLPLLVALVAVAASVWVGLAPARAAGPPPAQVRVMSYNMHHGEGPDGVLDLERIARDIEAAGADIVGLQEVDNHWGERSDWQDQAAWLAARLGMHHAYAANLDLPPGAGQTVRRQYGTAVLSRHPILSAENHLLTSLPYPTRPTEQRGLLHAVVNVRGAHLDFYDTHLDHQRAEQRISQVEEVLAIVARSQGTAILVGDLNAVPDSTEVRMLTPQPFTDAFAGSDTPTFPGGKRIDYILVRDGLGISDRRVYDSDGSDHLPLAVTVTIPRPQR